MATYSSDLMVAGGLGEDTSRRDMLATITRVASYSFSVSASVGDVIQICRIPHGAEIFSIIVQGLNADGAMQLNLGDSGSANRHGSATVSATRVRTHLTLNPYTVSVSDDVATRYITLLATVGAVASATLGNSVSFIVQYAMNR